MVQVLGGPEMRVVYWAVLTLLAGAAGLRLARRRAGGDWMAVGADAFLLAYLVQYLAVCLPGLLGILSPLTMGVMGLLLVGGLWALGGMPWGWAGGKEGLAVEPSAWTVGALAMVVGFAICVIYTALDFPVLSDDALTYHFPAAARWLQSGRLVLHETWFFNPANTYSPLAGSAFIAWMMGLMGNDLLADLVQVGPWVFLWFALVEAARGAGVTRSVAAVVAAAAVLAQPFFRASFLSKDDLFVAAFFVTAVAGLSREKLADGLGPWRLGIAVGLMLAVKYTALLSLPLLLLLVDQPIRAGWRWKRWGIAVGCVLLLAGPWFVRNWLLTGNPIYPVTVTMGGKTLLPGLFEAARALKLRSLGGIWATLTQGDNGLPWWLLVPVVGLWGAMAWRWRERASWRALAWGPPLALALFVWKSPYAELRFVYPALALLFLAAGVSLQRLAARWAVVAGAALMLACAGSAWPVFIIPALIFAGAVVGLHYLLRWASKLRQAIVVGVTGVTGLTLALVLYVYWPALAAGAEPMAIGYWGQSRGNLAEAWQFVRRELPSEAPLAYSNGFQVYPLMGSQWQRPVFYVPLRHGVRHLDDLPSGREPIAGEQMETAAARWAYADSDVAEWLEKLQESGARYLFVERREIQPEPAERTYALEHPERFTKVFENDRALVFKVGP